MSGKKDEEREEGGIREGRIVKGGQKPYFPTKPQGDKKKEEEKTVVMNEYHFIMGLRKDKLSDNTTVIIVDDSTMEIVGKVKVLPIEEEKVSVIREYVLYSGQKLVE